MKSIKFILALSPAVSNSSVSAADNFDETWLNLIKRDFAPTCVVTLTKVGLVLSTNAGYREEQWFLSTCRGNLHYSVSYCPPTVCTHRTNPFEVQPVHAASSAMPPPNPSSKQTREKPRAA